MPTRYWLWFETAEKQHKSVAELLTGKAAPQMSMENVLWARKRVADARLEQQRRPARKGRR